MSVEGLPSSRFTAQPQREDQMWDIVRWDPWRDLGQFRREFDRLIDGRGGAASAPWSPASDVYETEDAIVITAELPGVKDADVDISGQDGMLTIRGERRLENEVSQDRFRRLERSYRSFQRSFRVPPGVREEDIKASVAYGVLRITIPKPAEAKARKVPIASG